MSTATVAQVPIQRPHGAIVLEGQINGQPAAFLSDNGSDATLIDESFARSHGMAVSKSAKGLNTGLSTVPTGSTEGTITIGDAFKATGQFVTADLGAVSRGLDRPIAGVLGGDALAAFVVVVNPAANWIAFGLHDHLRVTQQGAPDAAPAKIAFAPGYRISAQINGNPVSLKIDYGSVRSAVSLRADTWDRVIPSEARTAQSATSMRADGSMTGSQQLGTAKQLKLSDDVWIGDVPVLRRSPSVRSSNEGLLGLGILGSGVTTLDTAKGALWLYPAGQGVRVQAENAPAVPRKPAP
ncbi:retropepsin-like aspartic protease [Sphingomonas sp.]|uniref:retropepsin-like aspartic protease n=1 Tax=Sphingomonas sp. TaxID=28214 RepID=UPI0028B1AB02|nr:retropepsin-like aspartic protease [Sphingomonas sp.]